MALSRRCMIHIVNNQHLRHFSDKSGSNFWEILPKRWRQPRFQNPMEDSLTAKLAPSVKTVRFMNKFNPFDLNMFSSPKRNLEDEVRAFQENVDAEAGQRGYMATLSQFLVFYGAKVRLSSNPQWISRDENCDVLPSVSETGLQLTGIDLSYLEVDYAFVKCIKQVSSVTCFTARGCPNFDNYCLDHLSANLTELEELDLSDCPSITSKGLGILSRCKKLRLLNISGIQSDTELELLCVLMEDYFPNLTIEGVTYQSVKASS